MLREQAPGVTPVLARELLGDEAGLLLVLEPIALALDVDGGWSDGAAGQGWTRR